MFAQFSGNDCKQMQTTTRLVEVFESEFGKISQCEIRKCFVLEFENKITELNVPCFFCLKRTIDKIDLKAMAESSDRASDINIIAPHGCSHCFALNLTQILQLKELLDGAKVMLELNSILHEYVYKPIY